MKEFENLVSIQELQQQINASKLFSISGAVDLSPTYTNTPKKAITKSDKKRKN